MIYLLTFIIPLFIFLFNTHPVYAIIILPALILIPIAQVLASVIGFLTLPLVSLGLILKKQFRHTNSQILKIILLIIAMLCIALVFYLKSLSPDRPWF